MSFRPEAAAMCLDGTKTRTRRIFKPEMCWAKDCMMGSGARRGLDMIAKRDGAFIGTAIWSLGSSIAIKPKRTARAIGRVMCVGLRVEHVQDITEDEARREGILPVPVDGDPEPWWDNGHDDPCAFARKAFEEIWRRLNPRGPNSWDANPLVVAIEFRPLQKGEQ